MGGETGRSAKDCRVQVDGIGKSEWNGELMRFADANIYQTWEYGEARWGEGNVSHLLVRHRGEVRSMAQVILARVPVIRHGIAYMFHGPLWRKTACENNREFLETILGAIKEEYVDGRGLHLRIAPHETEGEGQWLEAFLVGKGFKKNHERPMYRTILMDICRPPSDLRSNLTQNWRRNLAKAEKEDFEFVPGTDDGSFRAFMGLYDQMRRRKRFVQYVDVKEFRSMQARFVEGMKMKVLVCRKEDEPVGAIVFSMLGDVGLHLFTATGDKGLSNHCSYLLYWKMILDLRDAGTRMLDLGGISERDNPGGYQFKRGLAGKDGREVNFMGQYDFRGSRTSEWVVRSVESLRDTLRKVSNPGGRG